MPLGCYSVDCVVQPEVLNFFQTVLPPLGLLSIGRRADGPAHTAFRLQQLEECEADEEIFDLGLGNGMSCLASPQYGHSKADHISCLFAGERQDWPGLEQISRAGGSFLPGAVPQKQQSAASWLAALLAACEGDQLSCSGTLPFPALDSLGHLKGPFAFVVYDAANYRVLAARDRGGKQELFWGVTADGHLLFSSSMAALEDCNPTATAFPAGSVFVSSSNSRASQPGTQGWTIDGRRVPGTLHSFVKSSRPPKSSTKTIQPPFKSVRAVPRVNSQSCLCGAVYRVASDQSLTDWTTSF